MNRREQFERYVEAHRAELGALGVESLGLFGSVARGVDTSDSDIDILVSFCPKQKNFSAFMELADRLEREFGEVDLLTRESVSPRFSEDILQDLQNVRVSS